LQLYGNYAERRAVSLRQLRRFAFSWFAEKKTSFQSTSDTYYYFYLLLPAKFSMTVTAILNFFESYVSETV